MQTFFLIFAASAEQKNFTKSLEREQNAFERLIHHKKTMPPPILHVEGIQEIQVAMATGAAVGTYNDDSLPSAVDTRTGRGKAKADSEKREIAVDVREFRSALPSFLHQGGIRLGTWCIVEDDAVHFLVSNHDVCSISFINIEVRGFCLEPSPCASITSARPS
jgi:DNA excision repair protein ERCC-4